MLVPETGSAPRASRALLTRRGWSLEVVAVVLTLGGLVIHLYELFPLALAAQVLVVGSLVWVRRRRWEVDSRRYLHPSRVAQGSPARVRLMVTNHQTRPTPILSANDPFDEGRRFARFSLSPIAPGDTLAGTYEAPTAQRGLFWVGPLELRCSDPFGLACVSRRSGDRSALCVHPTFEVLPPLELRAVQRAGSDRGERRLTQHGEDFYALREYQTGDDLRRVHWSSSARVDRLMIREEVDPAASRVALIGDLRRPVHTAASFERTLSVLASLADAAIRGNHSVRVTCSGGPDSGWGDGPAHTVAILDLLAAAQTSPPDAAVTLRRCIWERAQGASSVIVVTSDAIAAADLTTGDRPDTGGVIAVARSSEHRNDHREASVAAGPGLPWPVLSVAPGVPFGQIWARRSAAFR